MKFFKHSSPEEVEREKKAYMAWLESTGRGHAKDYPSNWSRIDKIVEQLGYEESILSLIVGRAAKNKKDAAGLTLIIASQLKEAKKGKRDSRVWANVATSLRTYALGFLLKDKCADEAALMNRLWARKPAANIDVLFRNSDIRNRIRNRLTTQERGGLPIRAIHDYLSEEKGYIEWLNGMIKSVNFYGHIPMKETAHPQKPEKVKFKDIDCVLFETDGHVSFRKKGAYDVYTLLTPLAKSGHRKASCRSLNDLEIDHEPAISKRLNDKRSELPNIMEMKRLSDNAKNTGRFKIDKENCTIDKGKLLDELRLVHHKMELRMMEAKENREKDKKSSKTYLENTLL